MAQQIIEAVAPCYLLASDFTPAFISGLTRESTVPVYLADSNNADGIATVGIVQGDPTTDNLVTTRVYGKLDVISTNWDVLGEPTVDANGNVTYPNMADVIIAGVVTFTGLLKVVATGAATDPVTANAVGDKIKGMSGGSGSPPAAAGSLLVGASAGVNLATATGRVVARDGAANDSTIWVDLRAS